jgi:radical SAM/Cys-rich protein
VSVSRAPDFDAALAASAAANGVATVLRAGRARILQVNVGKLCNLACRHCHVDAGPHRTSENMSRETMERCLDLLDRTGADTLDVTGGAPELHPHFRWFVDAAASRGVQVIDRCNLTVLLLAQHADLPAFLGERGVEIVASLPSWRRPNTDAQRGEGVHDRSIEAMRRLNAAGYGQGDPRRRLTLVHNPAGAFLPGSQASMEREWKAGLARTAGVTFDRLIALNNLPIRRFRDWLVERGQLDAYMELLVGAFNPAAIAGLMCRDTLSVGWDGTLYDCDFNQQLELPCAIPRASVADVDPAALAGRRVVTGEHCFGCTAGAGSSCGGATA